MSPEPSKKLSNQLRAALKTAPTTVLRVRRLPDGRPELLMRDNRKGTIECWAPPPDKTSP